eukprot:Hpha_TRINITY_DN13310_c0_g2::TRINITY_DN13310_c0_g2_i4::g.95560::m.95560
MSVILLFVEREGGGQQGVEVCSGGSVADVLRECGPDAAKGILSYQGKELRSDALLADTGLSNEAVVQLHQHTTITFGWTLQGAKQGPYQNMLAVSKASSLKVEKEGRRLHCDGQSWHGGCLTAADKVLQVPCFAKWYIQFAKNGERRSSAIFEAPIWAQTGVQLASEEEKAWTILSFKMPVTPTPADASASVDITEPLELDKLGSVVVEHELSLTSEGAEFRARVVGRGEWRTHHYKGHVSEGVPTISISHLMHGTVLDGPTP